MWRFAAIALGLTLSTGALGWDELGLDGVATGRTVDPSDHFVPGDAAGWHEHRLTTAPLDLGMVAAATADTLRRLRASGAPLAQPAMFSELGVSIDDVLATLDLVARTAFEDLGRPRQRLQDPRWVAEHFSVLHWRPDREGAAAREIELTDAEIRLTKYVVYSVEGSRARTDTYDTALYAVPSDEVDGEPGVRMQLTRMDVYAGAFAPGGVAEGLAEPIVWLTREQSNQALLQGTVHVRFADGTTALFNVHKNNGRAWQPGQKDQNLQDRYWYFREVDGILGLEAIRLRPQAAVAGDVFNVGLGKLVAIEWPAPEGPELRLVVLADTGGAFQPNLFQLDYLAGTFPSAEAYAAWSRGTPTRVAASILVRRP